MIVQKTGWDYNGGRNCEHVLFTIQMFYGAYNLGRLQQHLDLADVMPYWNINIMITVTPDQNTLPWMGQFVQRQIHFENTIADQSIWLSLHVIAHDEHDLKAMGKQVSPPVED